MKPNTKAFAIAVTLTLTPLVGIALAVLMKSGNGTKRETAERAVNGRDVGGSVPANSSASTRLILVSHEGDTALDRRIREGQEAIAGGRTPAASLERLGWLFVEKARVSSDPGFYKLAEQCALALDERSPGDFSAMLLRGHVLQNLHQFKQAEPLARKLVAGRGAPSDHGLLGDVLTDLGRLDDAIAAYQSMMDLRPDSQAHARAAHVRWLKGDLMGATEAMRSATSAIGSRNAESAAWMNTRLAFFEFQSGDTARAEAACATAIECVTDFPPALLIRGRMQLAAGKATEAVENFRRAAKANPLPEYLWLLAESLRETHRETEAMEAEAEMLTRRAADDPRTVALFLATRGEQTALALQLAQRELESRADILTHDALAWTLAANGRDAEAWKSIERALAEGTQDARIFLHAGVVAARLGRPEAAGFLARARHLERLLLPSERRHLNDAAKLVASASAHPDFTAQR